MEYYDGVIGSNDYIKYCKEQLSKGKNKNKRMRHIQSQEDWRKKYK